MNRYSPTQDRTTMSTCCFVFSQSQRNTMIYIWCSVRTKFCLCRHTAHLTVPSTFYQESHYPPVVYTTSLSQKERPWKNTRKCLAARIIQPSSALVTVRGFFIAKPKNMTLIPFSTCTYLAQLRLTQLDSTGFLGFSIKGYHLVPGTFLAPVLIGSKWIESIQKCDVNRLHAINCPVNRVTRWFVSVIPI